jgi:hypothetical protein
MIPFITFRAFSSGIAGQAPRKTPLQERSVPPAAIWDLRLAESVGDGATDAAVVALDVSDDSRRSKLQVG